MNKRQLIRFGFTLIIGLWFSMLNPIKTIAAGTFYVAPGGNDAHACTDPAAPCATIQAAVSKAAAGDAIKVSMGIYTSATDYVVYVDKDLDFLGGWDTDFNAQIGKSIIDGDGIRYDFWVIESVTVTVNSFIFQNGRHGIANLGNLSVSNCDLINNSTDDYYPASGIGNSGSLLIEFSNISGNGNPNYSRGGGISHNSYDGKTVIIRNSTISDNNAMVGGGIYTNGDLVVTNSTISNNKAHEYGMDGGGIRIAKGITTLKNVTIAGNESDAYGGGISISGGSLVMGNSIIANNMANNSRDCYSSLPVNSLGYNIIGDSLGCVINVTLGDQLDVDPKLGILQDNGGPTRTYSMYANSPAIDMGDPIGCTDDTETLLVIDQRGFPRPLDGDQDGTARCDIGAVEVVYTELIPPLPVAIWYVSPSGNNSYDCLTPLTACATITGALDKALPADSIYVAGGMYTNPTGAEVVSISKDISLSGGWNESFTSRSGVSIIDGQMTRRGVLIGEEVTVQIEYFTVQNCLSADFEGGGMYVGNRSRVTLSHMLVQNNRAGKVDTFTTTEWSGGGIAMGSYSLLRIRDSRIEYNTATSDAGGIKVGYSTLVMTSSVVAHNSADRAGGIGVGAVIDLTNCVVAYNRSGFDYGGGIYSSDGVLTLKDSLVIGNEAAIGGGGIYGHDMNIENSTIAYNTAQEGGGIFNFSQPFYLEQSAVIGNYATYKGGGIRSGGYLYLVNSTIAYNTAGSTSNSNAYGGGIYQLMGNIQISNGTISRNWSGGYGGGIHNVGAPLVLRNSLLADNYALIGPDCSGPVGTAGFNLIGNMTGCTYTPGSGDLTNLDARIYRLFGLAPAMVLFADSPAIETGNPEGCRDHLGNLILIDQLGSARPIEGDGHNPAYCDIGAVEFDPDMYLGWVNIPLLTNASP